VKNFSNFSQWIHHCKFFIFGLFFNEFSSESIKSTPPPKF
jgi:hypothetical protein